MIDITALDLSLTGTGWATLRSGVIEVGRISTPSQLRGCERMRYVLSRVLDYCEGRNGQFLCAIEGPSYASNMSMAHESAGLWWQVRMEVFRLAQPVVVISPHSLQKYATGKGVANKPAVLAEAARRFPHLPISTGDEADALWLLAMCAEKYREPICDLPAVNRSAIHAVVKATKRKPEHPAIEWPVLAA